MLFLEGKPLLGWVTPLRPLVQVQAKILEGVGVEGREHLLGQLEQL